MYYSRGRSVHENNPLVHEKHVLESTKIFNTTRQKIERLKPQIVFSEPIR